MKVEFFRHSVDDADIANVAGAMRETFLTTGRRVRQFESDLAAYCRRRRAVGVSSATAGLHLALIALGVGAGDEVITTPMSFVATANAVLMTGAVPVFVDVKPETGNIDPGAVEVALTDRTRAILPVHLYGVMCEMGALATIARSRGLRMIEDAAHALESSRDGLRPGELSDAAVLSFYATKSITSGEGGAIVTDDDQLAERLGRLRLHGITKSAADRHAGPYRHWDMEELGYKCNLTNIQAAMLEGQLRKADAMRRRRERIAARYGEALAGVDGLGVPSVPAGALSGRHLFTIWVDPQHRDRVLGELGKRGVGVAVNYRPIHLAKYYRERFGYCKGAFPAAERIGASTISLPFYPKLTDAEIDYVIATVRDVV